MFDVAKTIKPDELAAAIAAELESYRQEVTDGLKKEVKKVAKETVKQIKSDSPKKSGGYSKGWKMKTAYEDQEDIRILIYNSKKPQLAHILEHGHAKVNGGRVEGKPHIIPAEQEAEKKLMNKVKVVVRGGNS